MCDADRSLEQARTALSRLLIDVADADADSAPLDAEFWLYAIRRPEFREQLATGFRRRAGAAMSPESGPAAAIGIAAILVVMACHRYLFTPEAIPAVRTVHRVC